MDKFSKEEKEILNAYENGTVKRVPRMSKELTRHQQIAEATFKKNARINIRISSKDLRALQKRALAEGIPYQTLIASVLHKYVEGRMFDRS
jgi:predicted DNA binding CopG/RHH family protein